ncbi:unnamed protein product [Caenorhabditis auriculariae]|uniref:Uncharacterized protein n=1 Tax=Caenorhabditis auriculariae TaxID=2777116 RepID=A0A8S1HVG5_9PELO|nr:unnamed protein product [Caenorhabditis auriculariae]
MDADQTPRREARRYQPQIPGTACVDGPNDDPNTRNTAAHWTNGQQKLHFLADSELTDARKLRVRLQADELEPCKLHEQLNADLSYVKAHTEQLQK